MELDDLTGPPEGGFVHSFKCARCRLEFAVFSRWTERHTAFNVTCPECGNVGAFLHYRADVTRRDEAWPWPRSTRMFDSVVYAVPVGAKDDPVLPAAVDPVELSEEFSALHATSPEAIDEPPLRRRSDRSLGQILLANGHVSVEQLELALEQHRASARSLGRVLVDMGMIDETDLVRALAEQLELEFVDLTERRPDPGATVLLSRTLAERYRAIPVEERDGTLLIAMSDPTNVFALDDIRTITEREVRPVVATAADIEAAIGWLSPSLVSTRPSSPPRQARTEDDETTDLRRGLEEGELRLHYLPIAELNSGRIWGVEALLRWDHPVAGLLGPIDFLPLAERSGLIVPIGKWVLHRACREGRALQQASGRPLDVSVNVSTRQLEEPDLAAQVARVLGDTGLNPTTLILEITETWPVRDMDLAVATLQDLKSLGVRLAVDNFGCGYASLEYVQRFPIDILKIHGSFVDAVTAGGESARLSAAVIELAGILNFERVAVGIERADQVQLLRQLGCDAAEGEYFGRPIPADAMAELLRAKSAHGGDE
jgi:EAL domain-containing protein (putative c-di-GMP-specific phosphodiesterase class I)/ribosomal protein S27E